MAPERPSVLDLVELSDIAWTAVDPVGEHESEERRWVELLPRSWPAATSAKDLSSRLEEIVAALESSADSGRLKLVATLMSFLAAHPEHRQLDEGLLRRALDDAFGRELPADVEGALLRRAGAPDARIRVHATHHPAPHVRRRRPAPEL